MIPVLTTLALLALQGSAAAAEEGGMPLGHQLGLVWVVPFALMLLSIAVLPLLAPRWWESNLNKGIMCAILGLPVSFYIFRLESARLVETGIEYAAFIVLLAALFIISGGIHLRGSLPGTPFTNTVVLTTGAIFANFIGTTGASMLLIRPVLRANERRRHQVHIVIFFIFIVSNVGGLLTPLGDPPLFLGFLRGVPFEWTIRLLPYWLLMITPLLILFYVWDRRWFAAERAAHHGATIEEYGVQEKLSVDGKINILLLLGVITVAFVVGRFGTQIGLQSEHARRGGQVVGMGILAGLSMLMTRWETRAANGFTLSPIVEVAVIFAGIFATMIPALAILEARAGELGLTRPWQFFWVTGFLSSFLDNAPTYLTFASMASGLMGTEAARLGQLLHATTGPMHGEALLTAISVGAVSMGANTYIGNGPNFMVKAIAEEAGIEMPSFFGYMKYTIGILLPLFLLVTFVFFRP
ncbi:sodium:proton antiporter [Candidatus Methylomirabilis sp.]|uniref:sodium:proton antiporter n=1 Tax=Candidatus Methylomirabilis sp. TaxID=2032687 RepID=UPI002A5C6C69|nr:sodium:proton antiporter [Candidatus Methylomirabilis sp.]